ncbi:zinc-dependent alcohol dehydrogenase family protein [Rhizobium tubonense]|uniref:Alcohol dehydrogenase n=1 Tax=Rhizobium tubonense TaxID=484088 RepID=A0A2W4CIM7_9HYPH|nr:NAD(P)-dependent alcohol dehydrogenase [Rhizobium tubonense]PZM10465.1 alcohol dehydrogenase [Rhizobium tubonense]
MQQLMNRWELSAIGQENLSLRQVPFPAFGEDEVLVKVNAVALNFRDQDVIAGRMGEFNWPLTIASDMSGTVVAVGKSVTQLAVGNRVLSTFFPDWKDGPPLGSGHHPNYVSLGGHHPGVLSEYVMFPAGWLTRGPSSLDEAEASTLPCAGLTAWYALVELGRVEKGQTVLIEGTGGVAIFGAQIAKAKGATVILVSGSDEKLERAKTLGLADFVINRTREDWVEKVYDITSDRGVDHVLEIVGGPHLAKALSAVAPGGRISMIGVLGGGQLSASVGPLLLKGPVIQGIAVGHQRAQENLVKAVDELQIKPVIDARYGLSDLSSALEHLNRGAFGKIVIDFSL